MRYLTGFLLAATLAAAAPLNNTVISRRGEFQGAINWFERSDCHNPCVVDGYCLAGQETTGMYPESIDPWTGMDSGCWDLPAKATSVSLSVDNGHAFSGINKSCEDFKKDNFQAKRWALASGDGDGPGMCNHFYSGHIKAVFYHW